MFKRLLHIDKQLFFEINECYQNQFFDTLMPILCDKYTWFPLYLILIGIIIYKFRWKAVWVLLFAGLTVVLADQISAGLIKPHFERLRPCNDPCYGDLVNNIVGCGNGYSFVSSHATNHFALAMFFISIFLKRSNRFFIPFIFLLWAASISFAQVYVGVHYPSDVIVGGLIGVLIGFGMGKLNTYIQCIRCDKKI
jgi:undecaprenyl-diphosphatase